jgi:hypothetical protein
LNPERGFIFKVFLGQLSGTHLASVVARSRGMILLRRNLVHSHISDEIAKERQLWRGPTSTYQIQFNRAVFITYCKYVVGFVSASAEVARKSGVPWTECWYDEIADPEFGPQKVRSMMDSLGIEPRSPDTHDPRKAASLFHTPERQDHRQLASSKVSNPNELLATLDELGLRSADDAFHRVDFGALHAKLTGFSDTTIAP